MAEFMGWRALFVLIGLLTIIPVFVVYRSVPTIKEQEQVTIVMQLSILKDKRILLAVAVTLFYVGGYSALFTYLTHHSYKLQQVSQLQKLVVFYYLREFAASSALALEG